MSWYKGIVHRQDNRFNMPDVQDARWLTDRSPANIKLQDGRVICVTGSEPAGSEGLSGSLIYVEPPHNVLPFDGPQDIWFTLTSDPVGTAGTAPSSGGGGYPALPGEGTGAGGYPSMPVSSPATVETATTPATGVDALPSSYPSLPGSHSSAPVSGLSNASPRFSSNNVNNFSNSSAKRRPLNGDSDEDLELGNFGYRKNDNNYASSTFEASSPRTSGGTGGFLKSEKFKTNVGHVFTLVVSMVIMLCNMYICAALGTVENHWLVVLAWTLFGVIVFLAIQYWVCVNLYKFTGASSYSSFTKSCNVYATFVTVLCVVWTNAFGIPVAWKAGQVSSAEWFLERKRTHFVNCWRKNTSDLNTENTAFIMLEEPQWEVDWKDRAAQKLWSLREQRDDGSYSNTNYNYCLAPMKYTGNVPCHYKFWAGCYLKTTTGRASSCGLKEAKECGWLYPSNGVVIRPVYSGQSFFNPVEQEDVDSWGKAMAKVDPSERGMVILYGAESPDIVDDQREDSDDTLELLQYLMVLLYIVPLLILKWYVWKEFN